MPHVNVRVNFACAVFDTVRSAPWQSFTVALDESDVCKSTVVSVAVFTWLVHVPAGSENVNEYVNVFGTSVYETVPSEPASVSVTLVLPSTIVVGPPNA